VVNDLYVAGWLPTNASNARFTIRRFNNDGTLDTGFDAGNGWGTSYGWEGGYLWFGFWDLASQPGIALAYDTNTGRLHAAGSFMGFRDTSLTRNMALDSTGNFAGGYAAGSFDYPPKSVIIDPDDGRMYVGGHFDNYAGSWSAGLMKVDTDGTRYAAFGHSEEYLADFKGLLLSGTTLYGLGWLQSYRGSPVSGHVVALDKSTGQVLSSADFDAGTGFGGTDARFLLKTNKAGTDYLYARGNFTTYNGNTAAGQALLLMNGTFVK
jgi:hypothetical protein